VLDNSVVLMAIESGLETNFDLKTLEFPKEDAFCDEMTSIVVRRGKERQFASKAVPYPIPCPLEYLKETVENSEVSEDGLTVSLGQTVAKKHEGVDHKDWVSFYKEVCRVDLVKAGVKDALFKILLDHTMAYHKDFPIPGVTFKDPAFALKDPETYGHLCDSCVHAIRAKKLDKKITKVIGIDSKGFIYGSIIAKELGIGFVMLRKKGKLPGEVISI